MRLFGCLGVITLVLQLKVLLKRRFGKMNKKLSKTMAEISLFKRFGNGKMSMEVKLTTNLEDLVSLLTGQDLHLLWMNKDQKLLLRALLECTKRVLSIDLQDLLIGVANSRLLYQISKSTTSILMSQKC